MTDKEYQDKKRECWEEFKRTNLDGEVQWQPVNRHDVFCAAFDRAYALGKQENDAYTEIHGWIARDLNGDVFLYENNPERGWDEWVGRISSEFDFKKLRWTSDPIEVEIIIKRKKNG